MNQNPLFIIIFEDQSNFIGGNLQETKWLEIPKDKKIHTLYYRLPTQDYLMLGRYQKYYQFIEVTQDLTGENKGKINLEYAYILGKLDDLVQVYKIDLKTAQIEINCLKENNEWIQKLNISFWRG